MPGKPSIERQCGTCGATFYTWPVHIRKGNGKFCSTACSARSVVLTPLSDRVWAKVNKDGPIPENRSDLGPCWDWLGAKNSNGYGHISRGRRGEGRVPAHQATYELMVGPVPDGNELDHLCRRPSCVRPSHLDPVTHRVNCLRGVSPRAKQAAQTHCIHGHPFDDKNTYRSKDGRRACRACHRLSVAQRKRQIAASAGVMV